MDRPRLYANATERKKARSGRYYKRNYKAPGFGANVQHQDPPPDHVLADAQFRNALPDLMFGDPKPGQSALDKRQR